MPDVVVHTGVVFGAAAAIALLSFGLASWLYNTTGEIKHLHKRIDRLVRARIGIKHDGPSLSPPLTSSPFPVWINALRGDVELLKEKNRFLEEEVHLLRVRLENKPVPALLTVHTPSHLTALHSLATPPPPIPFNPSSTPPPPLPLNLPPPLTPAHLSRAEWIKAAEELVWCTDQERKEKKAEIEEALGNTPAVLAIIHELYEKSSLALDASDKRTLTQEFGERLYSSLVEKST